MGILNEDESHFSLIGVANLFLDPLFVDACIGFEYDVPIVSQQAEISGRLRVRLQRVESRSDIETNVEEEIIDDSKEALPNTNSKSRVLHFKLSIIEAFDLPRRLNNLVFCQYRFWGHTKPFLVQSLVETREKYQVKFNYEKEFHVDCTEEFTEYCIDGALSIEVLGLVETHTEMPRVNSLVSHKKYVEEMEKYNQMLKYQSLIDSWNEVSKSFELHVKILELNKEGNWSPVEIKTNETNNTGGVYQLKQGQSRQISVRINQAKPKSIMWYNGVLFNLQPICIDKVSVGCVIGNSVQSLDSYQDSDLAKLREKCKEILEARKQYLYSQLKELTEADKNDDEKERYESLCKQLVDLGAEQAAIDAPEDNSGLPGSTIEWESPNGMEAHVPIVFLNLDEDNNCGEELDQSYSDQDESEINYQVNFSNFNLNKVRKFKFIHGKLKFNSISGTRKNFEHFV